MRYIDFLPYCQSPYQEELIKTADKTGSIRSAAMALGRDHSNCNKSFNTIKARAAGKGFSPDHDMTKTVPEGYSVKGVSSLYDQDGNLKAQWVKSTADQDKQKAAAMAMIEALKEEIKPVKPTPPPKATEDQLANQYVITDYHLGCLAWGEETGADWNLKIAEELLIKWFQRAIALAPDASTAYFLDLGDTEHYDSILAVTPTSGNVLDADSRFQKVVRVMIRVIRQIVSMLLQKHERVVVIKAEGNHNISTSIAAREWLYALYENEPRVEVDRSARPYYCHVFGSVMLGAHHGHKKKMGDLPLLFASMFSKEWGDTLYRYCETGHLHHHEEKELNGMIVAQHQTLAAPDAHSARGGWISHRSAIVKTYNKKTGLCGYLRITPDMVG